MLNEMRCGILSVKSLDLLNRLKQVPNYPEDGIIPTELYPRNDNVNASNEAKLKEIPFKSYVWEAEDWEPVGGQLKTLIRNCLAPKQLFLKRNAQVMLIKNFSKDLVNGKRGIVVGFINTLTGDAYLNGEEENLKLNTKDMLPIVRFTDGIQQVIDFSEWKIEGSGDAVLASRKQIPLLLAWAISIHKSQGQTLDRVKVDLGRVFEKGQTYVALSRATSANSLQVSNFHQSKAMEENNNSYEKNENPNGSNTRIIPTTFLDLLNSTIDDADLVHFRLLSQAQAIGSDLTTGIVAPHLWQNLEQEWSEFNQDLRLTSGIGKIKKGKAIDGFTGLLEKVPHDMNILREISKIHVQTSEIPKAIELYLDAYSYYQNRPFYEDAEAEGSFGYSEINIMAELYMLINDFGGAIEFIKCGVRWLQGREDETWWNNVTGTRHQGVFSSGGSNAPLPLELRIKLGISRICMDGLEEGKLYDVKQYIDLYYEVAETYAEKGLFEDALTTYEAILLNSEVIDLGLCHRELGNFENAAEYFTAVVEDSPDNLDAKMSLAETYEFLGENEKALELVNTVLEARKFQRQVAESTPVRDPVVISLSSSSNSMTLQENQQLDLLYPCSVNGDKEASKEYLETARGLIEDWQNNSILSSKKQG
ncbi:9872_t:CDS:10 [Entrophospora sp. SA101]|nr:9872_t:CDS:10 [Entrophospora sp. SA101]